MDDMTFKAITGRKRSSSSVLESPVNKRPANARHSPISVGVYQPEAPRIWETLSEDVFRTILESAIEPEDGMPVSLADPVRLDTARKLCLISKTTAQWIEPLLYRSVALVTKKQAVSFDYALKTKSPEFLSQHVRALYIFYDDPNPIEIFHKELESIDFSHLFATLKGLEKLALRGSWCLKLCELCSSSPIVDLTLIEPPYSFEHFPLLLLSLRSLHIIDPGHDFALTSKEDGLDLPKSRFDTSITAAKLNAIPRICLDFTFTANYHPGRFVSVLGRVLKDEEERYQTASGSRTLLDRLCTLKNLYEKHLGVGSFPFLFSGSYDGPRSLWVKTNPFIKGRLGLPFDSIDTHTIWWNTDVHADKQVWDRVVDDYKQTGPSNRPAYWESPLAKESESRQFYRLYWLERTKYSVHYNELHWDRIAKGYVRESNEVGESEVVDGSCTDAE